MYCNHCGAQLPVDSKFCPNCQAGTPMLRQPRVARQLSLLAALWFAMAALRLVAAVAVFAVGTMVATIVAQQHQPIPIPLRGLMACIGVLVGITALLALATGWGLYKREGWGRTMALVMAFLSLFSVPLGTALGIYTLVVLLPTEAGVEWDEISK